MLPVFVPEVLGSERSDALGLLMTVIGVGGVVGTLLMARFSQNKRKGIQSLVAFVGASLAVIALSQVTTIWVAAGVLAIYQIFAQGVLTTNMTMVQSMTPDHLRGRVVGVYQMEIGLMPVGGVVAGAIATQWGVGNAFLIGGAIGLAVVIMIAIFSPTIRNLRI
jgi:MFS family permease